MLRSEKLSIACARNDCADFPGCGLALIVIGRWGGSRKKLKRVSHSNRVVDGAARWDTMCDRARMN